MKLFALRKDGGPESLVWGLFLVEIKKLFTVVLLNFRTGSREAYHSHAFGAVSWVLWGRLTEYSVGGVPLPRTYRPSLIPVFTPASRFHKVYAEKNSIVVSFRGPWKEDWLEYDSNTKELTKLGWGRVVISRTGVGHLK